MADAIKDQEKAGGSVNDKNSQKISPKTTKNKQKTETPEQTDGSHTESGSASETDDDSVFENPELDESVLPNPRVKMRSLPKFTSKTWEMAEERKEQMQSAYAELEKRLIVPTEGFLEEKPDKTGKPVTALTAVCSTLEPNTRSAFEVLREETRKTFKDREKCHTQLAKGVQFLGSKAKIAEEDIEKLKARAGIMETQMNKNIAAVCDLTNKMNEHEFKISRLEKKSEIERKSDRERIVFMDSSGHQPSKIKAWTYFRNQFLITLKTRDIISEFLKWIETLKLIENRSEKEILKVVVKKLPYEVTQHIRPKDKNSLKWVEKRLKCLEVYWTIVIRQPRSQRRKRRDEWRKNITQEKQTITGDSWKDRNNKADTYGPEKYVISRIHEKGGVAPEKITKRKNSRTREVKTKAKKVRVNTM
ncbi:hypothetical protein U1Q18_047830 [Sarracenia purpurea var. burkii]